MPLHTHFTGMWVDPTARTGVMAKRGNIFSVWNMNIYFTAIGQLIQ
jgi:hypothetical protein